MRSLKRKVTFFWKRHLQKHVQTWREMKKGPFGINLPPKNQLWFIPCSSSSSSIYLCLLWSVSGPPEQIEGPNVMWAGQKMASAQGETLPNVWAFVLIWITTKSFLKMLCFCTAAGRMLLLSHCGILMTCFNTKIEWNDRFSTKTPFFKYSFDRNLHAVWLIHHFPSIIWMRFDC